MEGSRAHTLSIVFILCASFCLGLAIGSKLLYAGKVSLINKGPATYLAAQRLRAIKTALKEGSREYEFTMDYLPPLYSR